MSDLRIIISSKTPLLKNYKNKNIIETECLFGEIFSVIRTEDGYCFGELLTDNYVGWVETNSLGKKCKTTHKVIVPSTNIYLENNPKSVVLKRLFLGSEIFVNYFNNDWANVLISNNSKIIESYVPKKHLSRKSSISQEWIEVGNKFLNAPYVWGGKTISGIDCSALLQLSIKTIGINLPRNTKEQLEFMTNSTKFKEVTLTKKQNYNKGLIFFWSGHVAFTNKKNSLLHANAFHMKVEEEPIHNALSRFKTNGITLLKIFILNN